MSHLRQLVQHLESVRSGGRKAVVRYLAVSTVLSFICLSGSVCAAEVGYTEISSPLLKHLMETDERVVVVNVLSRIEYEMHHITGSINIPINKLKDSDRLPADHDTPLVFYCMGKK